MTIVPFLRNPVGEYLVRPGVFVATTLLLLYPVPLVIAWWNTWRGAPLADSDGLWLSGFAILYGITAFSIWLYRWSGVWRFEPVHASETGVSWLAPHLPVPVPLTEIVILPALVALVGFTTMKTLSVSLGFWLVIAGPSLAYLSGWEFRRRRHWHRAFLDDTLTSNAQEESVRYHMAGRGSRRPGAGAQTFATAGTAAVNGARAFWKWWRHER